MKDSSPHLKTLLSAFDVSNLGNGEIPPSRQVLRKFKHDGDVTRGGRHGDIGLKIGRSTMKPIHDFVAESQAQKKPFFIWYGVYLPHSPHNAPERLFNKYKDVAPNEPTAWYWANVEWLDETCGELVDSSRKKK